MKTTLKVLNKEPLNTVSVNENGLFYMGVPHTYCVDRSDISIATIQFQYKPRHDPDAMPGVTEQDLLEIVRDRLKEHQRTPYESFENEMARCCIDEALQWLLKRQGDRLRSGKLGTSKL